VKRLLICTPSHNLHGGVERIIESLGVRLPEHGYDITFALARGSRFNDPARFRAEYPQLKSLEIDGTSRTATGRQRSLRAVIERADPDVVLMARLFDVYPVAARLKRAGHRLRLAIMIQGFEPEYYVDARRWHDFVDMCNTSGHLTGLAASQVSGIPAERVVEIAGGVAPPRRHRVPSAILRLGYVGRIATLQKRALDLADTLAELRRRGVPFTCVVAGTGPEEEELRRRLPDVTFRGWQTTEELYDDVYPELDVLLHFAAWEGVPIAPREAMAHGVVPVMSRFRGIRAEDHFREGVDSLTFDIGDIKAAADHFEHLHRDRDFLERLSAAACASQSGIRSEAGAAAAWAQAFDDVLAREQCLGELPPHPPPSGRLDRILPSAAAEKLRRLMGRRFEHADPGSEWPHWSGEPDPEVVARLNALADAVG
jgi:glycosyltransferase involved in cell wall biosynthesis